MPSLPELLSPGVVISLQEGELAWIAGEPEQNQIERDQLNRKLTVLMSGLNTCRRYSGRILGQLSTPANSGQPLSSIFGPLPLTSVGRRSRSFKTFDRTSFKSRCGPIHQGKIRR